MKQRNPYTTYTKEFKQEALGPMESSDRPAAELARESPPHTAECRSAYF